MVKLFDAISSACAEVTKVIKTYIDTVALVEKDPTVPAWAKKANKPEYKADEIKGLLDLVVERHDFSVGNGEINTGHTWIDGSPIYARAFSGSNTRGSGIVLWSDEDSVEKIGTCLGAFGFYGGKQLPANWEIAGTTGDNAGYARIEFYRSSAATNIKLDTDEMGDYTVVVFYTKITDAA